MAHESSPRPKKKHAWSDAGWKIWILFFFFDSRDIVHKEFAPPGQTVNHAFYKDVLERLRKRVQRVRTEIADDLLLHHNKAPAHTALSIRQFLAKENIPVLPHPPHSPELAPCDSTSSLSWNRIWRFIISGRWKTYKKIVTDELHTLTGNEFRYCYDQWEKRRTIL